MALVISLGTPQQFAIQQLCEDFGGLKRRCFFINGACSIDHDKCSTDGDEFYTCHTANSNGLLGNLMDLCED